jgi:hypothetical protein
MKIDKQDLYHGAALLQIIESNEDVLINRVSGNPYYRILVAKARRGKEYRYLYIKYVSTNKEPFRFSFSKLERDFLNEQFARASPVFIALVCSQQYVCVLGKADFAKLSRDPNRLVLHVETPERGRIRVFNYEASNKPVLVAHTAFPKDIIS